MGSKHNSAADAEQTALNNQQQINSQLTNYANQASQLNSQYYQPLLGGLSQAYGNTAGAISPGLASGLQTALSSQGNLSGSTGVNQNNILQQLTGYATNGNTNLQGVTPQLQNFFTQQMQQGLNPQVANNAQSQLSQQSAQSLNDAKTHATPGTNINALTRQNQDALLQNSTNLAGNLAQQSQGIMTQGAQNLGTNAANLDAQRLNSLGTANQAAQGGNTQALNNLLASLNQGQNSLNATNGFMNQGQGNLQSILSALSGMGGQYANQASGFGQQASQYNPYGGLASIGGAVGSIFGL